MKPKKPKASSSKLKTTTRDSSTRQSIAPSSRMHEAATRFTDPFLLEAGTNVGNHFRTKRAIIRLEQEDLENQSIIRALKLENDKLKAKLKRLHEQAGLTVRMEQRFEQLSSIIMESKFMGNENDFQDEEEEEEVEKLYDDDDNDNDDEDTGYPK